MIDKNPSRMIFNNIKISSNQQINALKLVQCELELYPKNVITPWA